MLLPQKHFSKYWIVFEMFAMFRFSDLEKIPMSYQYNVLNESIIIQCNYQTYKNNFQLPVLIDIINSIKLKIYMVTVHISSQAVIGVCPATIELKQVREL